MSTYSKKQLAASILKCHESALLGFVERANGDCSVVGPDGRKFLFTPVQLLDEAQRLDAIAQAEKLALKRIAQAQRQPKEAPPDPAWLAEPVVTAAAQPGGAPVTRKEQEQIRAEIGRVLGLPVTPVESATPAPVTQKPKQPRRSDASQGKALERRQKQKGKR